MMRLPHTSEAFASSSCPATLRGHGSGCPKPAAFCGSIPAGRTQQTGGSRAVGRSKAIGARGGRAPCARGTPLEAAYTLTKVPALGLIALLHPSLRAHAALLRGDLSGGLGLR